MSQDLFADEQFIADDPTEFSGVSCSGTSSSPASQHVNATPPLPPPPPPPEKVQIPEQIAKVRGISSSMVLLQQKHRFC